MKKKNFLEELKEVYAGVDLPCPILEEEEKMKNDVTWVLIAKKRGHGLWPHEEAAIEI